MWLIEKMKELIDAIAENGQAVKVTVPATPAATDDLTIKVDEKYRDILANIKASAESADSLMEKGARDAANARRDMWDMIWTLYPETKDYRVQFNYDTMTITFKGKGNYDRETKDHRHKSR